VEIAWGLAVVVYETGWMWLTNVNSLGPAGVGKVVAVGAAEVRAFDAGVASLGADAAALRD